MTQQKMLEIHAIVVDSFIKEKIKEYREQVERGEAPRSWLNGYIDGAIEYENLLLENRSKHIIERKNNMTTEEKTNEKRYLTTEEFIKKVEKLGLRVTKSARAILIYYDSRRVASIGKHTTFCTDTAYDSFTNFSEELREKLYKLIYEYTRTPLDKREEPQRYYLRFTALTQGLDCNYLNYHTTEERIYLSTRIETSVSQTQFTQKEIDEIREKFKVTLCDFEQIPVKEDEKKEWSEEEW